MNKRNLAFEKINFILLAVGVAIIIFGFILMSGSGSDSTHFEEAIFSATRIKVAPVVTLLGFVFVIFAIMYQPKGSKKEIEKK